MGLRRYHLLAAGLSLSVRLLPAFDCNASGREDHADIAAGASLDCNGNGVPDECDVLPVNYGVAQRRQIGIVEVTQVFALHLDGDGSADVAFSILAGITFFWNDGQGTFPEQQTVELPSGPSSLAEGDLDGDGVPELAASCFRSIVFLHGETDRRLAPWERMGLPFFCHMATFGDLLGDARPEVVTAGEFAVRAFQRSFSGAYEQVLEVIIGSNPLAVAAADLDGDHDQDLATGNEHGNVSVILNRGGGTFAPPLNIAAGGRNAALTALDIDADGDMDLIAGPEGIWVFLNSGNGAFEGSAHATDVDGTSLVTGDLDRDGDIDLARPGSSLAFVPQTAPGLFGRRLLLPWAMEARFAAAADLDRDGGLELIAVPRSRDQLLTFGQAAVQYVPDCNRDGVPDDCQTDCNANGVPDDCDLAGGAADDCDGNGRPDACDPDCDRNGSPDPCDLRNGTSSDCNQNGVPDGCDVAPAVHLLPRRDVEDQSSPFESLHAADLNGDGAPDLVASLRGRVRGFRGLGQGTFAGGADLLAGPIAPVVELAADIEGDGDVDLVVSRPGAAFLNDGNAVFTAGPAFALQNPEDALAGDFLGSPELEIAWSDGNAVRVYGREGNEFHERMSFSMRDAINWLLPGDFDGDGDLDIAVHVHEEDVVRALLNDAGSGFPDVRETAIGKGEGGAVAFDLNADGRDDLVREGYSPAAVEVLLGSEGGSFVKAPSPALEGPAVNVVAVADLDGDGDSDVAVGHERDEDCLEDILSFLINDGTARFLPADAGPLPYRAGLWFLAPSDLDADGLVDLAAGFIVCPCCDDQKGKLSVFLNHTQRAASADQNRNLLPDECETAPFRRGDVDADAAVAITDAIVLLRWLFQGGTPPPCAAAADANGDARHDLADSIFLLAWLFQGGPEPPEPRPAGPCAPEPAPGLGCVKFPGCG
jgi:hypothetical protein